MKVTSDATINGTLIVIKCFMIMYIQVKLIYQMQYISWNVYKYFTVREELFKYGIWHKLVDETSAVLREIHLSSKNNGNGLIVSADASAGRQ